MALSPVENPVTDYSHPQAEENFLKAPSAVDDMIEFLVLIESAAKMDDGTSGKKKGQQEPKDPRSSSMIEEPFIISERHGFNLRASTKKSRSKLKSNVDQNRITFMRQIDQTMEERCQARREREEIATGFRRLGNMAYRKQGFDAAIDYYTKGLENIIDTPVLYVNRACCYLKLRKYKNAIMDCDYVLINLDPKYIRAWLYRGAAYKRMHDEKNFERCVAEAKRLNHLEIEFIEDFLIKMHTLL